MLRESDPEVVTANTFLVDTAAIQLLRAGYGSTLDIARDYLLGGEVILQVRNPTLSTPGPRDWDLILRDSLSKIYGREANATGFVIAANIARIDVKFGCPGAIEDQWTYDPSSGMMIKNELFVDGNRGELRLDAIKVSDYLRGNFQNDTGIGKPLSPKLICAISEIIRNNRITPSIKLVS